MKLIERTELLAKAVQVIGVPDIKVITGVRRSGKSKLLEALIEYVKKISSDANIIHVNYNLPDFDDLRDYKSLYEFIKGKHKPGVENFVFIDEIQNCIGFERAVNGLHASEKFDIFITGSNAFLLSSDLATLFTGRVFQIDVYPFSYKEYLKYFEERDCASAFERYLTVGGMAGSYPYPSDEARYNYLSNVFNTLIVRDIQKKYKIRHAAMLERVINFMLDNISNLTSPLTISNALTRNNDSITNKTVSKYLKYLCQSFLFYKIPRYDIKGKKYLASTDKYYLSDHVFRYAVLGTKNYDSGRMLENIVAIELKRRGYEVYVGVLYKKEIDFVAIKRNEKIYVQVSDNIKDPTTFEREVAPLLKIKDGYPKILLARTNEALYQYEGIQIHNLSSWLSE